MECTKCRVAKTCPRFGSSPLLTKGKKKVFCRIVGGYGRIPVDKEILSIESAARSEKDGPCLTIAEIPTLEDDLIIMEITKIFSHPILHERETVPDIINRIVPSSTKQS
jgi:hypothetical protein